MVSERVSRQQRVGLAVTAQGDQIGGLGRAAELLQAQRALVPARRKLRSLMDVAGEEGGGKGAPPEQRIRIGPRGSGEEFRRFAAMPRVQRRPPGKEQTIDIRRPVRRSRHDLGAAQPAVAHWSSRGGAGRKQAKG